MSAGSRSPRKGPRLTEVGVTWIALLGALCVGLMLLYLPRPVEPTETPGLHLEGEDVARVVAADRRLAARAPRGELVDRVDRLYGDRGALEGRRQPRDARQRRATEVAAALIELKQEHGEQAVDALRARDAVALDGWLASPPGEGRRRFLGDFESMLERYGLSHDGELRAPALAVRALFEARWNALHGLELTAGMDDVKLAAYWGWLALESPADPALRLDALGRYERITSKTSGEARAVLEYLTGRGLASASWFEHAAEEGGGLRMRNHALAALRSTM